MGALVNARYLLAGILRATVSAQPNDRREPEQEASEFAPRS